MRSRTEQRADETPDTRVRLLETDVDWLERVHHDEIDRSDRRRALDRQHIDERFEKLESRIDRLTGYAFGILVAIVSSAFGGGLILWVTRSGG